MKRFSSFFLAVSLTLSLFSGCMQAAPSSSSSMQTALDSGQQKSFKVAYVADGVFGGYSMNDAMHDAMTAFTEKTGVEVTSVEVSEFSDQAINARNFAQQGYDLIFMGGAVSEVIPEIASEYPNTHFVLNKGTIGDIANVTSVQFDEADGGFLAGAFAVLMSKELSNATKVGWVGGERKPDLEKARYAFSAAAQYVGGECSVVYVGSFTDVAKGKEIATQMYNEGAVIVQAYAGGASTGVYQMAESMPDGYYAMGCSTGQFNLSPNKIVASAVVKYDEFYAKMAIDWYENGGKMDSGLIKSGLATGGTGLRYSPEIGDKVPPGVKDQITELEKKIISGEIKVPTTEESYNAFVAGL